MMDKTFKGMAEGSYDYLNRLLKQSGVPVGQVRYEAMVKIIQLLDENSLDGLLESMRKDYEKAKAYAAKIQEYQHASAMYAHRCEELRTQVKNLEKHMEQLMQDLEAQGAEIQKEKERLILDGCLPEDISRVMAYKAALNIGSEAYRRYSVTDQVLRSASNVVWGDGRWECAPKQGGTRL